MKSKIITYLFIISIFGLVLLQTNCDLILDPIDTSAQLTADTTTVKQFEIIRLFPKNITLTQESYDATFGGEKVQLSVMHDTLIFMIPEITPGNHKLLTTIKKNNFSIDFSVIENDEIQDPVAYLKEFIEEITDSINTPTLQIDSIFQYEYVENDSIKSDYKTLRDSLNYYKEQFLKLSTEDQQKVVQVIAANKSEINDLKQNTSPEKGKFSYQLFNTKSSSPCNYNTRAAQMQCRMTEFNKITSFIDIIADLDMFSKVISLGFGFLEKLPFNILLFDQLSKLDEQYIQAGIILASIPYHNEYIVCNSLPTTFNNKKDKIHNINIEVCNIKKRYTSGLEWENTFVTNLSHAIISWNRSIINKVKLNKRRFPLQINPLLLPEKSIFFSIKVNNQNVTSSIKYENKNVVLNFSTNQATTQKFTYSIVYNDGFFIIETDPVSAEVKPTEPYSIEKVSGDNQTSELGKTLTDPIKVIVKDINGNPFPGAKVNFAANNGGSVSQSQVNTEMDGTASVTWKINTSDLTQTLNVTCFKGDGSQVINSPVSFTAIFKQPYSIEKVSGDNQTGELGKTLTDPIKVIVKDINGNPFAGAKVNFEANNGGSVSQTQVQTGTDGTASITWKINTSDLTQTLNVTCFKGDGSQVINSPVTFTAIYKQPYSIEKKSGDNQTGELGKTLKEPIKVIVKDGNENPFPGAKVNFAANNGGSVSQSQVITGVDGIASVTWTLGSSDLTQKVNVTSFLGDNKTPLQGSPLVLTATINLDPEPISIEKVSGDNQKGEFGKPLPSPIIGKLKDQFGNPFKNGNVIFEVQNGGSVSFTQAITGIDGTFSTIWTLGTIDTNQSIIVKAFRIDGTSALKGSPLIFNASAFPCNTTEDINILNGYEWDVTPHNPVRPWNKLSGYVNILRQAGNAPGASKDYTVYCNKNIKYIYMRYTSASGNLLETWTKEIVNLTSSSLILKNTSSSVIETWYPFK